MRTRAAQAITILLFALVMGVFWGTWFSLSRTMNQLSPDTFLAVGHQMIHNLGTPMAILLPFALLSALITLALVRHDGQRTPFWWLLAGLLLMVAALAVTLAVEVPIDNRIVDWTVGGLPADWRSVQARWELWHTVRTFLSIAALSAATISAVTTTRPGGQAAPDDRAAAADRRAGRQV